MKIAMYMKGMHRPGGVGSYLTRISALLRSAGHEVILLDLVGESTAPGAGITYVETEADVPRVAHGAGADLLHTHILLTFAGRSPLPVIRTIHNHDAYCPSGSRFLHTLGRPCDRTYSVSGCTWGHLVNHCGSVRPGVMLDEFRRTRAELKHTRALTALAVSDFVRVQMLRAGYDAARVHLLPLPAPAPRPWQALSEDRIPRFLFLGRLTPQKGVDWLIRAASQVTREIAIDIAGTGHPLREKEYRDLSEKLGLSARVTFHPWLGGTAVEAMLARARALVFPSIWHEPAGLVGLEAMTGGRAVIAGRVGGIPEIVSDGEGGLLVDPGDVNQLAAAIDRLADDAHLAEKMGRVGQRIAAERFSADAHLARLMEAYEKEIAAFGSGISMATGVQ